MLPAFASARVLEPWVSEAVWGKVIGAVPNIVYIIVLCLVFFLAMLKNYAYTTFEDVSVSFLQAWLYLSVSQFSLGFVICLLMSNLVFTLFSMLLFAHLLPIPAHSLLVWRLASIRCHLIFHLKNY